MALKAVAERGSESTPFQLAGNQPVLRAPGDEALWRDAGGHMGYYGFLRIADARIGRRAGVGVNDLCDRNWRDAYDDGAHPSEEADAAMSEELGGMPE